MLLRDVPDDFPKIPRNALVWLPVGSNFFPINLDDRITLLVSLKSIQCLSRMFCFSCQQFCPSSVFCRLWVPRLFAYCPPQSIKQRSLLPLVEQWEEYKAPNYSKFAAIEENRFLAGTQVLSALKKVGNSYQKKDIRRECRKFLENFVNCVLSTVAARSAIGQGLTCFCPPNLVGGDDHAPMQFFDMLLAELLHKGWGRGAEMEACKSEYQSFVQEQRQLERTSTRSRPDVENVLTFCSSQAGFRVRRHLYKICIVSKNGGFNLTAISGSFRFVSGISINSTWHSWTSSKIWKKVYGQFGSGGYQGECSARCLAVRSGFCERSCFHPAQLFLKNWCRNAI